MRSCNSVTLLFGLTALLCVVAAQNPPPVRIGMVRDSSAYASWDTSLWEGVTLWAKLLKAQKGGLNVGGVTREVEVVTFDTKPYQSPTGTSSSLDGPAAATGYKFLANSSDGVDVFFGCYNTARMLAVQPVAEANKKILLSQGAGGDALWQRGSKMFFSSTLPVSKGIYSTLNLLMKKGATKFALLAKNDASPLQAIAIAQAYLKTFPGIEVTYYGNYSSFGSEGVRDLTAVIKVVQTIEHDVFFYGGTPEDLGSLGTVFKVLSYAPKAAVFGNTVASDIPKQLSLEQLADGWMFYTAWEPWMELGDSTKGSLGYGPSFASAFKAEYGKTPVFLNAGMAVMGVVLEAALLQNGGNLSGPALRDAILSLPVLDTFYGKIKFNENGTCISKDVGICVFENGGDPRLISISDQQYSEFQYPVVWPWSPKSETNKIPMIVGIVVGVCGAAIIAIIVLVVIGHRQKREAMEVLAEAKEGERKNYKIEYKELIFGKLIGSGNFGQVFVGEYRGADVAIKKLKQKNLTKAQMGEFTSEVSTMVGLRHPNILLFMGACNEPANLCLVTEYMPLGNLYDVLHESMHLPPSLVMSMAVDIAKGLLFIHSANMLHRDLKSPNVLVDKRWNLKIADFGLTCLKHNNDELQNVSVPWTAPEVFAGKPYTDKSDVYSFGIILWELMSRKMPYENLSPAAIAPGVVAGKRPLVSESMPPDMVSLFSRCWDADPAARPQVTEIRRILDGMTLATNGEQDAYSTTSLTDLKKMKVLPQGEVFLVSARVLNAISLWEWQPMLMMNALIILNKMFRKLVISKNGYEVKNDDHHDRFLYAFQSVNSAINFCLTAQETLLRTEWPAQLYGHPDAAREMDFEDGLLWSGLRVKMGIYSGIPTYSQSAEKTGYTGPVIQAAEGLGNLAAGGQILLIDKVVNSIVARESLEQNVISQLGRFAWHGSSNAEMLYQINPASLQKRVFQPLEEEETLTGSSDKLNGATTAFASGKWLIDYSDLSLLEIIGTGSYGEVHKADWKGKKVAVKKFLQQKIHNKTRLELHAESVILSQLKHPNIVKFLGVCAKQPNMCIVMEYMGRGNLKQILLDGSIDLNWQKRLEIVIGIAKGMKYLHASNIIHRDVKSTNILVDDEWNVKIADFGLSTIKATNQTMTQCGTVATVAPEIFEGGQYSEKADIYSFSMVLWEIMTRTEVWKGWHAMRITTAVQSGERPKISLSSSVSSVIQEDYVDLMTSCWDGTPDNRPAFDEILTTLEQIYTQLGYDPNGDKRV